VANAIAVAPGGQVVLVGRVAEGGTTFPQEFSGDIGVLRFDDRLAGTSMVMLDQGASSRLLVRAKDSHLLASAPGSIGDPTLDGATLVVSNPSTLETATFTLPAALWKAKTGSKPGSAQYKYKDSLASAGPCRTVTVKSGRVLKVKCSGSLGGFTLDEGTQGTLDVRVTLGSQGGAYCLAFGAATLDQPGAFKARSAPAPANCD